MGIITVTERESAERCGWQHEFNSKNFLGLESANPLRSLSIGTLWHKTMDALAQKQAIKTPHKFVPGTVGKPGEHCAVCTYNMFAHVEHPDRALAGYFAEQIRERYISITGREPIQLEMEDTYKTIDLVREMLKGYLDYYDGRLIPEGWSYIQPEQQFFREIPDTEHCTCYLKPSCICQMRNAITGKRISCRYKHGIYTRCKCEDGQCKLCRVGHILEGTIDALIQHDQSGRRACLENKTFSIHPNIPEMRRTSQFVGYDWIGQEMDVKEVLYNGIWTRDHVPDGYNKAAGRKWNIHDLYVRRVLTWSDAERANWIYQTGRTALRIFDPAYTPVRVVPPVGGCNGVNNCSYKTLCDARFHQDKDYNSILRNEYRKRDGVDVEEPAE